MSPSFKHHVSYTARAYRRLPSTTCCNHVLLFAVLVLFALSTASSAQSTLVSAKTLVSTRGTVSAGGVLFSNFKAPAILPFSHPQGALPNDAGDIAVSAIVAPDGSVALTFTPFDPATGIAKPLFINAQRGSPDPGNLVRNITFDATVTAPNKLPHSVTEAHGPGSNANADTSVASIAYYLEPGTGAPGLLVLDSLSPPSRSPRTPAATSPPFASGTNWRWYRTTIGEEA